MKLGIKTTTLKAVFIFLSKLIVGALAFVIGLMVGGRLASLLGLWRCRAGIGCIGRPQLEPIRAAAQRRPLFGQPDGGRRGPWRGARVVCGVLDASRIMALFRVSGRWLSVDRSRMNCE